MVEPAHARALHRRRRAPAGSTEAAGETLDADDAADRGAAAGAAHAAGVPVDALDGDDLPGLVERVGDRWVLTRRGRLLANEVAVRLR